MILFLISLSLSPSEFAIQISTFSNLHSVEWPVSEHLRSQTQEFSNHGFFLMTFKEIRYALSHTTIPSLQHSILS
jgi:hypothetical protein